MAKYRVTRVNPKEYKRQIIELWKKNLPSTNEKRFDWLNSNPAGPAIWFLAFQNTTNELAGCISILPRMMSFNGETIRAGILGDFMVDIRHRVFGPNILLPKTCLMQQQALKFDLIYTIPNSDSKNIIHRAGFTNMGPLLYLVRPNRLEKYTQIFGIRFLVPIINHFLRLLTMDLPSFKRQTFFREENSVDDSFDKLWGYIKNKQTGLIGDHDSEFLKWHFFQNPINNYRMLTKRRKSDGQLLGYIIFSVNDNSLEIFDIVCIPMLHAKRLIKKVIEIAQREKCKAIYCTVSAKSPFFKVLKRLFFLDSKYPMSIYTNTHNNGLFSGNCIIFAADRNV